MLTLENVNFYVYNVIFWEGESYGLINTTTGKETSINGIPQVSPNKKYIFTTPYYAETYFNYNGMMLFDCSQGDAILKWGFDHTLYGPYPWRSCWLDNQTILCEFIDNRGKTKSDFYITITIKPYQKK